MLDLVGRRFGQYQIVEQIGSGGMATVFRAVQPSLQRDVAVKVLPPSLALDPTFVARFRREATAVAALEHPNIVPVYDFIEHDDLLIIVMRLIRGGTLRDRLGRLDWRAAAKIGAQIAGALEYAHQNGVIHRDIKPTNVLIAGGEWPMLTDFGIAQFERQPGLTLPGLAIGTPEFLSPEQAVGRPVDRRSDVYSLGIVLFQMATGRLPYSGPEHLARIMQQPAPAPPLPSAFDRAIPAAFDLITARARQINPAARYQTIGEVKDALEKLLLIAPGPPITEPIPRVHAPVETAVVPAIPPSTVPGSHYDPTKIAAPPGSGTPPPDETRRSRGPHPLVWAALAAAFTFFVLAIASIGLVAAILRPGQTTTATPAGQIAVAAIPTGTATPTPIPPTETPEPPTPIPPTFTPIPVGSLLFADNMQVNTNGWCLFNLPEFRMFFFGGTYYLVNNTEEQAYFCELPNRTFSSFALEVEITKVAGPENWGFGPIFRRARGDDYDFLITGNGSYSLSRYVRSVGQHDNLIEFTHSDAINQSNAKNRLKVVARGPEITLYINDFWIAQVRDDGQYALTSGAIGFHVGPGVQISVNAVRVFAVD